MSQQGTHAPLGPGLLPESISWRVMQEEVALIETRDQLQHLAGPSRPGCLPLCHQAHRRPKTAPRLCLNHIPHRCLRSWTHRLDGLAVVALGAGLRAQQRCCRKPQTPPLRGACVISTVSSCYETRWPSSPQAPWHGLYGLARRAHVEFGTSECLTSTASLKLSCRLVGVPSSLLYSTGSCPSSHLSIGPLCEQKPSFRACSASAGQAEKQQLWQIISTVILTALVADRPKRLSVKPCDPARETLDVLHLACADACAEAR